MKHTTKNSQKCFCSRLWHLDSRHLDTLPHYSLLKVGTYDCLTVTVALQNCSCVAFQVSPTLVIWQRIGQSISLLFILPLFGNGICLFLLYVWKLYIWDYYMQTVVCASFSYWHRHLWSYYYYSQELHVELIVIWCNTRVYMQMNFIGSRSLLVPHYVSVLCALFLQSVCCSIFAYSPATE